MEKHVSFVLNCSRVGLTGGLKTFSDEVMGCLVRAGLTPRAVLPSGYPVPRGVQPLFTPSSLAGGADLSLLRPVKWLLYSRFKFPVPPGQKILTTTHHVLPNRHSQVVTIHDLRPYFYPDTSIQRFYFHEMLPRALSRCDGVLTVSESSRLLICEIYRISQDRVCVVPNALSDPAPALSGPSVPNRECSPYLLTVGATWSHKNIESLLKRHRLWTSLFGLKIVGGKGPYQELLISLSSKLGILNRVEFLSGVDQEKLDELYRNCAALIYPSKMEGFGLPPLEAMLRRRPAIVSDIPVFRELYGRHAAFVDVNSDDSWSEAFETLQHIDGGFLDAAEAHARTYTRGRMAGALTAALERFWPGVLQASNSGGI
jgi:glycosyltransferase involved in cell wall biosynthesis